MSRAAHPRGKIERKQGYSCTDQEQGPKTDVVDNGHSGGRGHAHGKIGGQEKVTQALRTMLLRADVGDQRVRGCVKEGQADSLEEPGDKKRPKRKGPEVGKRGKGKEKGACNHEALFRNPQKGPADKRPENQGRDKKDADEDADLGLAGPRPGEIKRKGGDEEMEHSQEDELRRTAEDEFRAEYLARHFRCHECLVRKQGPTLCSH